VAHTCYSNYTGGRDQEDRGSKPAWTSSLQDPISKKSIKKGLVVSLKEKALSSNPLLEKNQQKKLGYDTYCNYYGSLKYIFFKLTRRFSLLCSPAFISKSSLHL
jgi:hypothetical protein